MASIDNAEAIEKIIDYKFQRGYGNILKALTAAGAVEEDWDGNRKLAQFGTALSEFLLNYLAFEAGVTRAYVDLFRKAVICNEHRASIAVQTGISRHIRFNKQEGARSPSVLAKAVNAIMAVVFLDCGGDIGVVLKTMRHLGIFTPAGKPVDPTMLSLANRPDSLDVRSLARSLFNMETANPSSSIMTSNDSISSMHPSIMQHTAAEVQKEAADTYVFEEVGLDHGFGTFQRASGSGDGEASVEDRTDEAYHDTVMIFSPVVTDVEVEEEYSTDKPAHHWKKSTRKRLSLRQADSHGTKRVREHRNCTSDDVFGPYLTEEIQKCRDTGHEEPQDTFLTPNVQQEILDLSKGKRPVLAKILMQISSPCLIGGMQAALGALKDQSSHLAHNTTDVLSKEQRFQLIADMDRTMSLYQLLRRYHILTLFKECKGNEAFTCERVKIPADFARSSSKRGNPLNRSIADVTSRMTHDVFPNIDVDKAEFDSKRRLMARIRRLGQRLHMLETRFGEGILGLMLDQGLTSSDVGITDAMIMAPTDVEFARFVDILERSQGQLLRNHSRAMLPAVRALTVGPMHEDRTFHIEKMTTEDFTKYPKGSPVFLGLIGDES